VHCDHGVFLAKDDGELGTIELGQGLQAGTVSHGDGLTKGGFESIDANSESDDITLLNWAKGYGSNLFICSYGRCKVQD